MKLSCSCVACDFVIILIKSDNKVSTSLVVTFSLPKGNKIVTSQNVEAANGRL